MKKSKHNGELRLVSFAAVLGIVFMLIFSGVSLTEVPSIVGQAVKIAISKTTSTATCSETDSGNDISVTGVTSLKKTARVQTSKTDSCIDEDNLKEYYCGEDNVIKEEEIPCICEKGACVGYYHEAEQQIIEISSVTEGITITQAKEIKKQAPITQVAQTSVITAIGCIDSDKGKIYDEQGTTSDGSDSKTDACRTNGKLVEYYCDENDVVQEEVVSCASGEVCSSGACITEGVCTDSEDTFDLYSAGKVVGTWYGTTSAGEWTDTCSTDGKVNEYYCRDDGYAYCHRKDCPSGYACSEGVCIDVCSDTDESGTNKGTDYYTKGTATGYWQSTMAQGTWTDYCTSDGLLIEYTCYSGYVYSSGKICSDVGKTCINGACI